jgi:hypothetical protein
MTKQSRSEDVEEKMFSVERGAQELRAKLDSGEDCRAAVLEYQLALHDLHHALLDDQRVKLTVAVTPIGDVS